jgi:hypothetical protein
MRLSALLSVLALPAAGIAALPAAAQDPPLRFELTPYGAYRIGGEFELQEAEDTDTDGGTALELREGRAEGLILNIRTTEGNTQWEVLYAHQSTEVETQPSFVGGPLLAIDLEHWQFGGTYLFDAHSDSAVPFIALTAGISRFEPGLEGVDAEHYWSGSIGGGVQLRANRHIGVRVEGRAFASLVESDSALFCFSAPEAAGCALAVEGTALYQLEARVGVVVRF